ncbi:MAG TPA: ABC-2 family transporter protein [Oligoflexia bacterium]|mgnify:CR=1 FL=1|nr:ABC-2 family transporter protein [Oligoflexia bacterium]HMP47831.1 ABC-2 family transporter protein [Oligoflexia bacterium]
MRISDYRIYFFYFLQFIKSRAEYKVDFIFGLIANVLVSLFGLLFILLLIDGEQITSIGEWSRNEVLFIYGYSMLAFSLFNMVAQNLYRFGDKYIIEGQFDRVLLRPLGSIGQVIFESFNLDALGTFALGIFILFKSSSALQIDFFASDYLWLAISVSCGAIILLSVFVTLASFSFYFEDRLGIGAPVYSLITFGRYPTPIFNKTLQMILSFIIPFAFVAFYPATHFLFKEGFHYWCYSTPLVALVSVTIAGIAWKAGVYRYSSTGS